MREFSEDEAELHNGLTERAWALLEGELLLNEPVVVVKLNWVSKRKLNKAKALFQQALNINPEGWSSMWAVGKIEQKLEHAEEAFRWFCQAHQINPQQPDVAREAGLAALDLGKAKEALQLCRAAL